MWNEAFAYGGAACTIRQFESLTDIRINNYIVVDFRGFRNMVDAIDGVEVCVPQDINDQEHGIVIKAGTREISGREALSYVRVRHVEGTDGSDLGRITRQQAFVAAMANKVLSGSVMARPDRLLSFLDAATDSLTTDIANIGRMARIGYEFKDIGLKRIQFITVPWQYAPSDPNRVEWLPEADDLWEKVRNDAPLGKFRDGAITAGDRRDRQRRQRALQRPERVGDRRRARARPTARRRRRSRPASRRTRRTRPRPARRPGSVSDRPDAEPPSRSGSAGAGWTGSSATSCPTPPATNANPGPHLTVRTRATAGCGSRCPRTTARRWWACGGACRPAAP